jgi:hypothetical protein
LGFRVRVRGRDRASVSARVKGYQDRRELGDVVSPHREEHKTLHRTYQERQHLEPGNGIQKGLNITLTLTLKTI